MNIKKNLMQVRITGGATPPGDHPEKKLENLHQVIDAYLPPAALPGAKLLKKF